MTIDVSKVPAYRVMEGEKCVRRVIVPCLAVADRIRVHTKGGQTVDDSEIVEALKGVRE
jgi:hypothetical protein